MGVAKVSIKGREKSAPPLDSVFPKLGKGRGRPFAIEDDALFLRRNSIVQFLEWEWGVVGLRLSRAKSHADIQAAMTALDNYNPPSPIQVLRHPGSEPTTSSEIRRMQKELAHLGEQARKANEEEAKCREAVRIARAALDLADPSERALFEQEEDKRSRSLERAIARAGQLRGEQSRIRSLLDKQWAHFAREELLRFIRSGRYSLVPTNFANAIAGLPQIGWRQSFRRCLKQEPVAADGRQYRTFTAIRKLLRRSAGPGDRTERFRVALQTATDLDADISKHLKQKWLYLRRVLDDSLAKPGAHPRDLSFLVSASFERRSQSRSPADMVQEELEKL